VTNCIVQTKSCRHFKLVLRKYIKNRSVLLPRNKPVERQDMTCNYFRKMCCFRMSSLPDCPPCSLTLSHPPAGELVSEGAGRPPSPALIKQSRQGDVIEKRRKRHTRRCHRETFERKELGIMVMEYEPLQQLIPFQKFNDDIYSMLTSGRIRQ